MIDMLHVENFKCHRQLHLPLKRMTLLTGMNAGGKSSSIQGMLLLSQLISHSNGTNYLPLNGPLLRLGTSSELPYQGGLGEATLPETRTHSFGFEVGELLATWELQALGTEFPSALQVVRVSGGAADKSASKSYRASAKTRLQDLVPTSRAHKHLHKVTDALKKITFISAVRGKLDDLYDAPDPSVVTVGNVGAEGQYAAWCLQHFDNLVDVDPARYAPGTTAPSLRQQLNSWGNLMFPGFECAVNRVSGTSYVQLTFRTAVTQDYKSPANVGFGLSYSFPVILAGLIAAGDSTLIVDSPEAHLHPRAQSLMGRYLAQIAASGVQVIVETHSDHVLNGLRVAVKESVIPYDDVLIHFFSDLRSFDVTKSDYDNQKIRTETINKYGRLSGWPAGFFDQFEVDLARL